MSNSNEVSKAKSCEIGTKYPVLFVDPVSLFSHVISIIVMDNLGRSDQRVYCCLYEYLPPRNTTLTIIFTDLGLEQEKLRGFLLQKIEEGPLGRDGILGLVTSIQAAQIDPTATVPHPTCFYRTLGGEDNKHYIICLVAAVKPEELSLFLPDLQLFVESVEEILLDPNFSSSAERDTKLQDYLPSWWWLSVDYLIRAILLLGKELPPMLHAASIGKQILVKPHKHAEDISRYILPAPPHHIQLISFRFADTIRSGLPQSQTQDEELETVIVTLSNADGLPVDSTSPPHVPPLLTFVFRVVLFRCYQQIKPIHFAILGPNN